MGEYYATLKRKEVLTCCTWDIATHIRYRVSSQFMETDSRLVGAWGCGEGGLGGALV